MSSSAHQCCKAIIQYVPENDEHVILNSLIDGYSSKFSSVRKAVFEYLQQILEVMEVGRDETHLTKIENFIKTGITDADGKVRGEAFNCLALLSLVDEERSDHIEATMSTAALARYNELSCVVCCVTFF